MDDLISRQAAIQLITGYNGVMDKSVAKRLLIQLPSAQPIQTASNYLQSLPTSPLLVGKMPSAQPDRSLWFHIGELCVDESKGNITAEVAIKKIRALLRAETIYCKDCKYRDSFNYCTYKTRAGWITKDNGHCSEAERREE